MRNGFLFVCALAFFAPVLHATSHSLCPPIDRNGPQIVYPPSGYNRFYQKMVSATGIPILGSAETCDRTLQVVYEIKHKMLSLRPDVEQQIINSRNFIAVFGIYEKLTDIPENRDLAGLPIPGAGGETYDNLCGSGGMVDRPMVVCEKNVIGVYDPYLGRMSVTIHELGHTIMDLGLDSSTRRKIKTAYTNAVRGGLFPPSPGNGTPWIMTNDQEFFACGTGNWFNATDPTNPNGSPHQSGRAHLQSYAPELYNILAGVYPNDNWRYPRR